MHAQRPVLETQGVTKTFTTGKTTTTVLKDVALRVDPGEFVAIMGPSGAGKSVLLHVPSGLVPATSGEIFVDGTRVSTMSERARSRLRLHTIGFVFQQPHFIGHLSLHDNILLPSLKAGSDADHVESHVAGLLERFCIDHVAHHVPAEVSGGQLQRAALCRALGSRPVVLFADEPTGALHSRATQDVMSAFSQAHDAGVTIVMVTHDAACAARAQRVIYLRDGAVVDELVPTQVGQRKRHRAVLDWLASYGY